MEPQTEFTIKLQNYELLFAIAAINYSLEEILSTGYKKNTEAHNHCVALAALNRELGRNLITIANEL